MICADLATLLGFECTALDDAGSLARIWSPFTFEDGVEVPIYAQRVGKQIRFFDDGVVLLHFMGRGLNFDDARRTRFVRTAAEESGVSFTDGGEIEAWVPDEEAPSGFAKYMTALLRLTAWERSQRGIDTDADLLVDEVAMCLRAWKPDAEIVEAPQYEGISGSVHALHFNVDGTGVLATHPHLNAASAALRRLVDIRSNSANSGLKLMVVIDDRTDPEASDREGLVLQAVAKVLPFTSLEKLAHGSTRKQ